MANKTNQHYVPQFYFRFFSHDGKSICVLNRRSGRTVGRAPIKGQASKSRYYGDPAIEGAISRMEEKFCGVLRQIRIKASFEKFTGKNFVLLLQNIMLQKSRTMAARKRSKGMQDRLLQLHMEIEVNKDDSLDVETRRRFLEIANQLEADPKQYQQQEMLIAIESAIHLVDLLPIVLHNRTNRPFIFGDAPVVFSNPHLRNIALRGVLGLKTPGLLIYYPLDSRHSIILIDGKVYRIKGLRNSIVKMRNLADVAALNKLEVHNATSAVYFSEYRFSQYVSNLWRQERKRLADHQGKVVEAPGFDENGEPIGDIFHSFQPQLPLIPRLSFLEYRELPAKEYRFGSR
jgi:uncharacterized protein DUF4238